MCHIILKQFGSICLSQYYNIRQQVFYALWQSLPKHLQKWKSMWAFFWANMKFRHIPTFFKTGHVTMLYGQKYCCLLQSVRSVNSVLTPKSKSRWFVFVVALLTIVTCPALVIFELIWIIIMSIFSDYKYIYNSWVRITKFNPTSMKGSKLNTLSNLIFPKIFKFKYTNGA